jgi:hypothetical protein
LTHGKSAPFDCHCPDVKEDSMSPEKHESSNDDYIKSLFQALGNDTEGLFVSFRTTHFFVRKRDGSWTTIPGPLSMTETTKKSRSICETSRACQCPVGFEAGKTKWVEDAGA